MCIVYLVRVVEIFELVYMANSESTRKGINDKAHMFLKLCEIF